MITLALIINLPLALTSAFIVSSHFFYFSTKNYFSTKINAFSGVYYVNAIESIASAIEMSIIGAKNAVMCSFADLDVRVQLPEEDLSKDEL